MRTVTELYYHDDMKKEWQKESWRKYRQSHLEQRRKYAKEHRKQARTREKKYRETHRELCRKSSIESYQRLRRKTLKKLGNKCVRCGFSDSRALQIDHVNGEGAKEREELCCSPYLKKVLADTEGNYQLLCANCNMIKREENGEYRKHVFDDGSKLQSHSFKGVYA